MAATEIRSWSARAASSWRALGRMPAYQLPIVLGGAIAGVALLAVAGGTVGLLTGLLVFAGAMWGLLKSF